MSTAPEPISFAALTALVRSSVEGVAATEPDPVDPFRGLYLSDEAASASRAGTTTTSSTPGSRPPRRCWG